jgi:hypothetical protein
MARKIHKVETATAKVKPCPFCGGPGRLGSYRYGPGDVMWFVQCESLMASCFLQPFTRRYRVKKEAVLSWNTRRR